MDGRGATQATTLYHGRGDRADAGQDDPLARTRSGPSTSRSPTCSASSVTTTSGRSWAWPPTGAQRADGRFPHDHEVRLPGAHAQPDLRPLLERPGPRLIARFGPRRNPENQITDEDRDIAASVQKATEQAMFAVLRDGAAPDPAARTSASPAGVAMNSKANGKLLASGLVDRVFVQPAATDDGTAVGAALAPPEADRQDAALRDEERLSRPRVHGKADRRCAARLQDTHTSPRRTSNAVAAQLVADGNIVGWFQGRMEFGPRALGNRSILADARRPGDEEQGERLRSSSARTGGPSRRRASSRQLDEYFEAGRALALHDPHLHRCGPEKRGVIPAVTHADNSARIQTVDRVGEPALLRAHPRASPKHHRRARRHEHLLQPARRADRLHAEGRHPHLLLVRPRLPRPGQLPRRQGPGVAAFPPAITCRRWRR